MARIVHVSNFGRRPKGAFQHSVENKISNGFIRNGHYVTNFSDRDIARAESWFGHRKFGISGANRALRDYCRQVKPDLLLLGHADVIRAQTLADIRKDTPSVRIIQWNVDPMFEPDNVNRILSKIEAVDATLVSTAGDALLPLTQKGHGVVGFLPNPVDFSVETGQNFNNSALPFDLFYPCGNPTATRFTCDQDWLPGELIARLQQALPDLQCLLSGPPDFPYLAGAAYQSALESAAIGFNLSRRNDYLLYSSDRLAHMCGNGMAVLIDRATGYERLFSDDEFAFYSTFDELIDQLRQLKADTARRQALAKAGRERYHLLFNEQIIAQYIADVAFEQLHPDSYPWPTLIAC